MKKILLVLAMIAASVFLAQPAVADDDPVAASATTDGADSTDTATAPEEEAAAEPLPEQPPQTAPDAPKDATPPADETDAPDPKTDESDPTPAPEENKAEEPGDANAGNSPPQVAAAPVKIKICHSTSSETNPYVENSPNASGDLHGHTGHTGGVFPTPNWGDIIPPFTFDGVDYPGMNWTTAGQAIYNNGCNIPDEPVVPLIEATPVPPTATQPTCGADGALVLPTTTGVIYESTPAGTGPGDYTVTASAAVGYVLTNQVYEEHITVLPKLTGPQCVINGLSPATAGITVAPPTCTADGSFVFNDNDNVIYILLLHFGNFYLYTALPTAGHYLTNFPFIKVVKTPGKKLTGSQCDSPDITICHRTNSNVNPYVAIGPDTAGVANGHDTQHEGPIWDPTLKANHIEWGDIIPPYHYNDVDYPGQNWTAEGIAFYNNGACDGAGIVPTEVEAEPPTADPATCDDDGALILPETEGLVYTTDPEGTGPGDYVVTATAANEEFTLVGTSEFEITVDEQLSAADCVAPDDGTDPVKEDDLLPDTGGLPLWILLVAGPMTAAGLIVLMRRAPVSRTSTGGGMPSYSLILPPAKPPVRVQRAHASTQHIGFLKAVGNVVAAIGSFFRGGRR